MALYIAALDKLIANMIDSKPMIEVALNLTNSFMVAISIPGKRKICTLLSLLTEEPDAHIPVR